MLAYIWAPLFFRRQGSRTSRRKDLQERKRCEEDEDERARRPTVASVRAVAGAPRTHVVHTSTHSGAREGQRGNLAGGGAGPARRGRDLVTGVLSCTHHVCPARGPPPVDVAAHGGAAPTDPSRRPLRARARWVRVRLVKNMCPQ